MVHNVLAWLHISGRTVAVLCFKLGPAVSVLGVHGVVIKGAFLVLGEYNSQ